MEEKVEEKNARRERSLRSGDKEGSARSTAGAFEGATSHSLMSKMKAPGAF